MLRLISRGRGQSPGQHPTGRELAGSDNPPAITIENVNVAYRCYRERPSSLKESMIRFLKTGRLSHFSTFDALSNVSIDVTRGSVVGLVGSNGCGKSTLLKVIAGVLPPSAGAVQVQGSVASLIELGAGFDAELNAIENIYLNASLHGKSRAAIKPRVQPILEFAELTQFAYTPIKYYSSGMYARLGFSCAIDIDPDILLVDEILSVGDERFNRKCKQAFDTFLERGKTIVIVSHDLAMLESICDKLALFSKGKLLYYGEPMIAIDMYRDDIYQQALG